MFLSGSVETRCDGNGFWQHVVSAEADAHARAVLAKATRENFPVAPRFLPREWRADLMALYGFARLVDDIGDGDLAPGGRDATYLGLEPDWGSEPGADRLLMLDAFEAELHRVFDRSGPAPRHPLLRSLVPTVRRRGLTPEPFLALVEANRQDQKVRRYTGFGELLHYCELSANPVGRLVLAVTDTASPERIRQSDDVCTALQIIEHLQDVAEDLRRDRVYLPAEDMIRFGVTEEDLAAPRAGEPLRALLAFEAERARLLLMAGDPLVAGVHGRLKLLLAGFTGGGRAALRAMARAGYDVLPGPPRATTRGLLREVVATLRREG